MHARPDTFRYRTSKFVRRNRGAVAAAALIALLLAGFSVTTQVQNLRIQAESETVIAGLEKARDNAMARRDRLAESMASQKGKLLTDGTDRDSRPGSDDLTRVHQSIEKRWKRSLLPDPSNQGHGTRA